MTPAIAVHLWSVHELAQRDFAAALDLVRSAGYRAVETMGFGSLSVPAAGRLLAERDLAVCAAHLPFPATPAADAELAAYAELGVTTLAWSLEPEEFDSREAMLRGVERINAGSERAARFGQQIAYHNHFAEFEHCYPTDAGQIRAYEALQQELDPRVVLELDLYWPRVVGADPAAAALAAGRPTRLVHLKDGPARGMSDVMIPITADSPGVQECLRAVPGLEWAVVELDRVAGSMVRALTTSRQQLIDAGLAVDRAGASR